MPTLRTNLTWMAAVLALAGCGSPTAREPDVRSTELADAEDRFCPKELPIGEDPTGHGFGVSEPADEVPSLLEPQEGWTCQYDSFERDTNANGTVYGWKRSGQPQPIDPADLPGLHDALRDLGPAAGDRVCTADLGPRWMVVYSHNGDLTGVVVDDYGCRGVRLTDDPHTTPPGADDQNGTVGGVLDGGSAILDALRIGRTD